MAHHMSRTVNLRSSQQPQTLWSKLIETVYGEQDTRTDFDRSVEAYLSKQQKLHEKSIKKTRKMLGASGTVSQDLVYAGVAPIFTGEVRIGAA